MKVKYLSLLFALVILGCSDETTPEPEPENKETKATWNESNWDNSVWQ